MQSLTLYLYGNRVNDQGGKEIISYLNYAENLMKINLDLAKNPISMSIYSRILQS